MSHFTIITLSSLKIKENEFLTTTVKMKSLACFDILSFWLNGPFEVKDCSISGQRSKVFNLIQWFVIIYFTIIYLIFKGLYLVRMKSTLRTIKIDLVPTFKNCYYFCSQLKKKTGYFYFFQAFHAVRKQYKQF